MAGGPDNAGLYCRGKIREFNKEVPIVLITKNLLGTLDEVARQMHGNGCIHKPFDDKKLKETIAEFIQ